MVSVCVVIYIEDVCIECVSGIIDGGSCLVCISSWVKVNCDRYGVKWSWYVDILVVVGVVGVDWCSNCNVVKWVSNVYIVGVECVDFSRVIDVDVVKINVS